MTVHFEVHRSNDLTGRKRWEISCTALRRQGFKVTRNPADVTCGRCRRYGLPDGTPAVVLADDLARAIVKLVHTHGKDAVRVALEAPPKYEYVKVKGSRSWWYYRPLESK